MNLQLLQDGNNDRFARGRSTKRENWLLNLKTGIIFSSPIIETRKPIARIPRDYYTKNQARWLVAVAQRDN
jgi:hypothetical protein